MDVELRKSRNGVLKFLLKDVTPAFANSIRRTILQGVPTMAIDEVEVEKNDSVMSDEILAHRLGQTPLVTPEGYLLPSECDCLEGRCPNCSVDLSLQVEGPSVIRGEDLDPSDPEASPVEGNSPIVRLGEGQKLEFNAIARLGFGEDHANWQPAIVSYKYMSVIDIDQDARDDWGECVESCPEDILAIKNDEMVVTDIEKCTMCEACLEACPDAIDVGEDSSQFIFRVESTGTMPPERLVSRAIEILKGKCEEFTEQMERF
ncbi:hypothetical protein AKJ52_01105 [candidate division MSBL1 archaeon SCGC-AAA382C18]|uniref:DNA-directed RNA polymerase subunit Rpo3 n=1 Tax=candidate division MSBL1 archaeon SCGC-AAA382C18 TaxID=1698281 RepID=A0A133VKT2_9EURY|nr:hypothetical protein AKJ52_01105 [candidate division MSBL1 archaeon SCGC-AAA382C18]